MNRFFRRTTAGCSHGQMFNAERMRVCLRSGCQTNTATGCRRSGVYRFSRAAARSMTALLAPATGDRIPSLGCEFFTHCEHQNLLDSVHLQTKTALAWQPMFVFSWLFRTPTRSAVDFLAGARVSERQSGVFRTPSSSASPIVNRRVKINEWIAFKRSIWKRACSRNNLATN